MCVMLMDGPRRMSGQRHSRFLGNTGVGEQRRKAVAQAVERKRVDAATVLRALGVDIPDLSSDFTIEGGGVDSLRAPTPTLDCGNSGTTARLMAGVVAARPIQATFVGDASLSRRPMRRASRSAKARASNAASLPRSRSGGTRNGKTLSR